MTKKEAVENHRKMWRWIAEKTIERKRKVWKDEYFGENKLDPPFNDCFCCDYVSQFIGEICARCPINWEGGHCMNSYYSDWLNREYPYWFYAHCADLIANLPERETEDFDIMEEDEDENFNSM